MKHLPTFFLIVDTGFIAYWVITALHLIPETWLYNDYTNPLLVNWNWSFMPIDILVSITGYTALYYRSKKRHQWVPLAIISLTLTSASGLMAIAFWVIGRDFELQWWLPNHFLLVYPWFFIPGLIKSNKPVA